MKKIWKLLSVIVVALALGACASDGDSASDGGDAADKKTSCHSIHLFSTGYGRTIGERPSDG